MQIACGRGELVLTAPDAFVAANKFAECLATSAPTTIGWGVGGPAQGHLARGAKLVIGDLEIAGPVLRLAADSGGALAIRHVAGNIGGEVLRRFVVTFDYARRVVYLAPAPSAPTRPFDADRAGLWINRHARGAVVGAVMDGGPAAAAGLRLDDVITSLDGEAAAAIGLDALRRRLAEWPAGRRGALEVVRGNATLRVALELRDLVEPPGGAQRAE